MDQSITAAHALEVAAGERFEFGQNWSRFLTVLDETHIQDAQQSMQTMLGVTEMKGKSFVDVGSGSGLFSLIARRMGARVHSLDYDSSSVACTTELRRKYFPNDPNWVVEAGSALDPEYLGKLGTFDFVYSWGVLHHTGSMWNALANVVPLVAPGGTLFISIYNDQGKTSRNWLRVKRAYNRCPPAFRFVVLWPAFLHLWGRRLVKGLLQGRPFQIWRDSAKGRGMSPWHDVVDWVGGYPFEVARPEELFDFYFQRGFTLVRMTTQGGDLGCNELVFRRTS